MDREVHRPRRAPVGVSSIGRAAGALPSAPHSLCRSRPIAGPRILSRPPRPPAPPPTPGERRLGRTLLLAVVVLVCTATLVPAEKPLVREFGYWCLVCGRAGMADVLANVLLFVPLGVGAALAGWPARRTIAAGLALSVGVELTQLLVVTGRFATLSDVVTNTTGAGLGGVLARHWRRLLAPGEALAWRLATGAAAGWLLAIAGSAWALERDPAPGPPRPAVSPLLAPPLSGWYAGRPVLASVGPERVVPRRGGPLLVLAGTPREVGVTLEAIGADRRDAFVPMLFVHGAAEPEPEVLVGQRRGDAVLRVRLRARSARLRVPEVRLRGFFDEAGARTRFTLSGGLRGTVLHLAGRHAGDRGALAPPPRQATLALAPTLGWALLAPFVRLGDPLAPLVTVLWLAGLLLPLGYWGAHAARTRARSAALLAGVAILAGLGVVPWIGGFRAATALEWAAAVAGLLGGAGAAWLARERRTAPSPRQRRATGEPAPAGSSSGVSR